MKALFLAAFTLVGVSACGDSDPAQPTCGVAGATQACVCAGGLPGAQSCLADGAWSACECSGAADVSGPSDVSASDAGADLTTPDTNAPEVNPAAPTVQTGEVSNVTATSARVDAEVTDAGESPVTARGVCYGTSPAPTVGDGTLSGGDGTGAFWVVLEGLTPDTTYYARAYATSAAGTSYGAERTFRTSVAGEPPTVSASSTEEVTSTSFRVVVTATNDPDDPSTVGAVFSRNPNPLRETADEGEAYPQGGGVHHVNMLFLEPNTTYYARAYALNGAGIDYGEQLAVTTGSLAVGDRYRGGQVVRVDTGLGVAVLAEPFPTEEPELPFGCLGVELSTGPVGAVGGGASNTQTLVSTCGAGTAAAFCNDRVTGSGATAVSDWVLPNQVEVRAIADSFSLGGRILWSSTWVVGSGFAKVWNGVSGQISDRSRGQQNDVRCVFYHP